MPTNFYANFRLAVLSPMLVITVVAQTPEDKRAAEYRSALIQLDKIKNSKQWDLAAEAEIRRLIVSQKQTFESFQTLSALSQEMKLYAQEASGYLIEMMFGVADLAFKRHQLETADEYYRQIIIYFSGPAANGIRERAKLGVEDVRDARRNSK